MSRSPTARIQNMYWFAYGHYLKDNLELCLIKNGTLKIRMLNSEPSAITEFVRNLGYASSEVPSKARESLVSWLKGNSYPKDALYQTLFDYAKHLRPDTPLLTYSEFIESQSLLNSVLEIHGKPYIISTKNKGKLFKANELVDQLASGGIQILNSQNSSESDRLYAKGWILSVIAILGNIPHSFAQSRQLIDLKQRLSSIKISNHISKEVLESFQRLESDSSKNLYYTITLAYLQLRQIRKTFLSFILISVILLLPTTTMKSPLVPRITSSRQKLVLPQRIMDASIKNITSNKGFVRIDGYGYYVEYVNASRYIEAGEFANALTEINLALASFTRMKADMFLYPRSLYRLRGIINQVMKNYELALNDYNHALSDSTNKDDGIISKDGILKSTLFQRAETHEHLYQFDKAINDYQASLKASALFDSTTTYYKISSCYAILAGVEMYPEVTMPRIRKKSFRVDHVRNALMYLDSAAMHSNDIRIETLRNALLKEKELLTLIPD